MTKDGLRIDEHGVTRCWWCGDDPMYIAYHDTEWGVETRDDQRLFEKLCLEGFQAGLSWITILRKRARFREVFHDFEIDRVARFTEKDIKRLLADPGIIRHRGKIEATINNAQRAQELIAETGSVAEYLWQYAPDRGTNRMPSGPGDIPSITPESTALSRDLKKRGWRFVGPTTAYAFMQSMGMVNDHLMGCAFRD